MSKSLKITVLVDAATVSTDDPEFRDPGGKKMTEYHVIEALRLLGHTVSVIGVFDNLESMIHDLKANEPDLVFNAGGISILSASWNCSNCLIPGPDLKD